MISRRSMVTGAGTGLAAASAALVLSGVPTASALAVSPTANTPNWINVANAPYNGNVVTALAASTATNNVLYFPAGTYTIPSTLTIPGSWISFVGDGQGATILSFSSTSSDLIYANNLNYFSISSLTIQGPSTSTAGAAVHLAYVAHIFITDVTFSGGFVGIQIDGSNLPNANFRYTLRNLFLYNTKGTAILIGSNISSNPPGSIDIAACLVSSCAAGIVVNSTGGMVIDHSSVTGSTTGPGISVFPGAGQWVTSLHFVNVYSDGNLNEGWLIATSGTGTVSDVELGNCWGSSNTMAGIDINGTGVNGVTINGGSFCINGQDGVRLDAGTNIVLNGVSAFRNNTSNTGYSGITIQSGSGFQITNCVSGLGGFGVASGNKQAYGIAIFSSSSNNFIVTGNRLPGNITGGIANFATGANQVVANNINF